jgi:NTP pyrophosphatase (non-canonical NTP hydrolase)
MPDPLSFPKTKITIETLSDCQREMHGFVSARGWYGAKSVKPQDPRNLAMSISIEANEILECFQWTEAAETQQVGEELADVVLYVAQLANVLNIDLNTAVHQKLEANHIRFPAEEPWRQAVG